MVVSMVSLGCAKNLVDSERMLYLLRKKGYELTVEPGDADIVIVNTCGFIQAAKEEAIETILELCQLKAEGAIQHIIVTGCLAQRYQEEAAELFPEVDAVIGIGNEAEICEVLDRITEGSRVVRFAPQCNLPLTGGRIISTLPFFAYLKIAEGCSNGCTYCAIPQIRGKYVSVPMDEVLKEARWLADNGVTELVVVAQDTTRYGEDLNDGVSLLPELLRKLCAIDGFHWIRILYCYPERISDELISVIAEEEKIVKYLDIPIQHCNGAVLKSMHREGDAESLRTLFRKLRERIPGITLRTTLMTGFPTETEDAFTELAEFAAELKFERMGCFAYSEEENTPAAKMSPQVDEEIRRQRADILMEQQMSFAAQYDESRLGTVTEAVIEGYDKWGECWFGRTAADAPDIDGKLFIMGRPEDGYRIGQYVPVKITDMLDYDLVGEVVSDEYAE